MADTNPLTATSRLIEVDDIVQLGSTPGETHGFECAGCQGVSGLRYGSAEAARRGLVEHKGNGHEMPRG